MKYKVIIFDVDGTLTRNESVWIDLHAHLGTDKTKRELFMRQFFNNEIGYDEWVNADLELFKERGATKDKIIDVVRRTKLLNGVKETLKKLKQRGYKLVVLSDSLDITLEGLGLAEFFDKILINRIIFDEDGKILRSEPTKFGIEKKADGLLKIAEEFGVQPEECVFVGDAYNDVEAAKIAGMSIALNCRDGELKKIADVVINGNDFREILNNT